MGVSIETGRVNQDKTRIIQDMSYIFKAIYNIDDIDLSDLTSLVKRETVVTVNRGAGYRAAEIIKGIIKGDNHGVRKISAHRANRDGRNKRH